MKRTIRRIVSVAAITTMSLAGTSTAQNWPSFRGANASGLGTGSPPVKWNVESGENIKWKVKVPGLAHSSPIIWGDRIFLTTAVSAAGEETLQTGWLGGTGDSPKESGEWEWQVLALDKKTGKTLWTQTAHKGVPKFKRHLKATHANGTPATDGKNVVAFFGSEGLYCYGTDGKLIWKKDLGPVNVGPGGYPDMEWGAATSPIIHDGKVILQLDAVGISQLIVMDIGTGSELMRVERGDDPTWCTPAIYQGKSGTQVVCNGYKKMAGYDLATGKELWRLHDGGDIPVPVPVISGDTFFITNGHSRSPIFAVKADASGDITPAGEDKTSAGLAWYKPVKGSYMPTPIAVDGVLYVANDNGIFTGFDAKTGEQIVRERLPAGGKSTFSASPVSADGRIYTTSEDGQIDVIKTGKKFEVLASNPMGEVCMATPAISDGLLIVRGKDHLFCIGK